MNARILLTAALALSPGLAAAETPRSDAQDLVYLGEKRPALIRVHVDADGQPLEKVWSDFVRKLFDFLDRDGDGVLDQQEAGRVPPMALLRLAGFGRVAVAPMVRPAGIDTDNDGKVTLDELAAHYRRSNGGPVEITAPASTGVSSNAVTEALFRLLDTDRDGSLSRIELAKVDELFARLDDNGDELVSAGEVVGTSAPTNLRFGAAAFTTAMTTSVDGPIIAIGPSDRPGLGRRLLARYDTNKDGRVSTEEMRLDREEFGRLDGNGDGSLDATELARWAERTPNVELAVSLGRMGMRPATTLDVRGPTSDMARKAPDGSIALSLDNSRITVRQNEAVLEIANQLRQRMVQLFKQSADGKDFIEIAQLQRNEALRGVLQPATIGDRDSDGKLTEKELNAYLDLQEAANRAFASIAVTDQGRGFFELLDANKDGSLGLRELRTAWDRLAVFDVQQTGKVSRDALPRQLQATIQRGSSNALGRVVVVNSVMTQGPRQPVATVGPSWFRRFDRNGDGDLSPREWLGTTAEFQRLDRDGDGLVSSQEAEAAAPTSRSNEERSRPGRARP